MTSFTHDSRSLAATYDWVSDLQFEGGKGLVERLGLKEGARVLELGCKTGRLTHLDRRARRVDGRRDRDRPARGALLGATQRVLCTVKHRRKCWDF
jgi:hypothetical protein